MKLEEKMKLLWKQVKIEENGCWTWQGRVVPKGGPRPVVFDGKPAVSMRSLFVKFHGENPRDSSQFVAVCENLRCVNPLHLEARGGDIEKRILGMVEKREGGCWLYKGVLDKNGYARIFYKGRTHLAHRISFELFKGKIPKGMCACHRCDVPSCVNPDHLFLGTMADNIADRDNKKRTAIGDANGKSKLTGSQVAEIKRLKSLGMQNMKISEITGVCKPTVSAILNGYSWRHVKPPQNA